MGLFDTFNVDNFQVTLSNTMFTPGGVVSGSLTFKVKAPMSFRRVYIKIIGKEKTHIAIRRKSGKSSRTSHYYSRINVHKEQVTLLGGLKGTDFKDELPPGDYNFPFAFVVPLNAPSSVPSVSVHHADGDLTWYVKAGIDIPFSVSDPASIAVFTVATAMPMSQYQTRAPFSSPPHRAVRTCCCCDQGVTTVQTNLNQNMVVFGRDTSFDGNISIDNSESKEDTNNIVISIHRVCWIKAQGYERTPAQVVSATTIQSNMKAGDGEKRFDFSIALPNTPNLVSCYRGHNMFYYYRVTAICDGDTLFTTNLIASNALDETNRSLVIDVDTPGPLVPAKEYQKYVYAPPPGAQPTYPQQPAGFIPQPMGTVPYMVYPVPGHAMPTQEQPTNIYGTSGALYGKA